MSNRDLLDDPAWHALTGRQNGLAVGGPKAACYRPGISPFAAITPDSGLESMADVVASGQGVVFMCADPPAGARGWKQVAEVFVLQMICARPLSQDYPGVGRELGAEDVAQMLALTELTEPGPFLEGTIEMGRYLGVEENGELIAMAGERFCLDGWTEISGVCTHPDAEGRGLAKALVAELVAGVFAAGHTPFLHVRRGSPSEQAAIAAYERLGFEAHQELMARVFVRS